MQDCETCAGTLGEVQEPPPASTGPDAAAFAWLLILLAVLGFEAWAVFTGRPTLSQWFRKQARWVKGLGYGLLVGLIVHLML